MKTSVESVDNHGVDLKQGFEIIQFGVGGFGATLDDLLKHNVISKRVLAFSFLRQLFCTPYGHIFSILLF